LTEPREQIVAADSEAPRALRHGTVVAVVNERAGSVGPKAASALEALLREHCSNVTVMAPQPEEMDAAMADAIGRKPEIVVVLGGDGTARKAAELAGPKGPPLILLPGGTMNVLPKALYGPLTWQEAIVAALESGTVRDLPGARAGEHLFFVAGIFGSPARMAEAREAVREGKFFAAIDKFSTAVKRAFGHRLRARRDLSPVTRAEAVAIVCPLFSKSPGDDRLETAFLDPAGALSAFRLGIGALTGAWRTDPATDIRACRSTEISGRGEVPAVLDGEPVTLPARVRIVAVPAAARVIALDETPGATASSPA
jgi:diacylglycerol kinase family enzyme